MIYSKQRELILQTLRENRVHPTADEIYYMLKPDHPELSLATVYRNLNQLAANGIVKKIAVPSGADRFDGTVLDHYHMICKGCGKVVDIPKQSVPEIDHSVSGETGCKITGHNIIFYGLCQNCNQ